ncbi:hypothetical protein, partial [Gemmatimonas sp.]|uniref:hypothetical protein n=1 Tax=Gemmatimonas sp. TaxID=1962908 RepID=UPI00391EF037
EGIGILIALDTLPDMFKTLLNVTSDMFVAVMTTPREQPKDSRARRRAFGSHGWKQEEGRQEEGGSAFSPPP